MRFVWCFAVVIILSGFGLQAKAATDISGVIDVDTTLTVSESPYHVGNLTVASSAVLTIEPGVILKINDGAMISIGGTLDVQGDESNSVFFTSIHDDTLGGDSNENGTSTVPGSTKRTSSGIRATRWIGISFQSESVGRINHLELSYVGYGRGTVIPAIYNNGGDVKISGSVLYDNRYFAVGQKEGSLELIDSVLSDNDQPVIITGGDAIVSGNRFENNSSSLYSEGVGDLTLVNNSFVDNDSYPVQINISNSRSFIHTGNIASGNAYNGIVVRGSIIDTVRLTAGDALPYIITSGGGTSSTGDFRISYPNNLEVATSGSLILEAGAVVKYQGAASLLVNGGELRAEGEEGNPVVFTSVYDDEMGGNTWDEDSTQPASGDWRHISISNGANVSLSNAIVRYGGAGGSSGSGSGLLNSGGVLNISDSLIDSNNAYGVRHQAGTTTINQSSITNHTQYGVYNQTTSELDATNNYWGSPSGPYHHILNATGTGNGVSDNVNFIPWLESPHDYETPCCSSVLFLPGIMSSRLYDEEENKLWETNLFNRATHIEKLKLNDSGDSINSIAVGPVIDTFSNTETIGVKLYRSFFDDLGQAMDDDLINSFLPFSYDWRLSLDDILTDGELENSLRELASTSKSDKVTIVAHSNGGLVAKALINKLEAEDGGSAAALVDKIVFVGVPQLGTPQAVATLLHGDNGDIPGYLTEAQARDFAQNAPMTYHLLPHQDYFLSEGADLYGAPVIEFEPGSGTANFINVYGYKIEEIPLLNRFLVGEDGRQQPSYNNLIEPALANTSLLNSIQNNLIGLSGDWSVPAGIEVHQIAGTGELTTFGITYSTTNQRECTFDNERLSCVDKPDQLTYSPKRTVSGDGTVVEHSALAMSNSNSDVKRWWVDLEEHNEKELNKNHKNLLEIFSVRNLVINNLLATSTNSYDYISDTRIVHDDPSRLTFTLHSPLSLSYTESDGTIVDDANPEGNYSRYTRFGEVQLIDIYNSESGRVTLKGEATGSFTLGVEEVTGGEIVASTTYSAIPSSTTTSAAIVVSGGGIEEIGDLTVDYEGDGDIDFTLEPMVGEVVTLPDESPEEHSLESLINFFKSYTKESVTNDGLRRSLLHSIDNFYESYLAMEEKKTKYPWFANIFSGSSLFKLRLDMMERQIDWYDRIGQIDTEVADELKRLLELMKQVI